MKSGNLNFLEPSGPLQAYNGTALNFLLNSTIISRNFLQNISLVQLYTCASGWKCFENFPESHFMKAFAALPLCI